jgi:hypothetical protein
LAGLAAGPGMHATSSIAAAIKSDAGLSFSLHYAANGKNAESTFSIFGCQPDKHGLAKLQKYYPDYLDILTIIIDIQEKIEKSRGERTKDRDAIYDEIENTSYETIIKFYDRTRSTKGRVQAAITREFLRDSFIIGLGVAELIVGLVAVILHFAR